MKNTVSLLFLLSITTAIVSTERCSSAKNFNSKLFCYYSKLKDVNSCKCSHIVLPADSDVKSIENLRNKLNGVKILVTVHEFNEGLVDLLKKVKVDGLEIDLKKLDSKNDLNDFISTARSKLGSDLYTVVSVPARAELLAKYYDFKGLTKNVDVFILQTAFLGASGNVTFHPSRLSGLWDMQNADSVVDLVTGLGAPLSKLAIVAPVQAFHFTLQDEKHTAPGSPALEVKSISREDLCKKMVSDNWTLEREQDQAGPYIYRKNEWIAFDDPMSIDIKAKYARVRGLSGLALKDLSQDGGLKCGGLLLEAAYNGLSKQSRAPRGAVLQSLEREILTSSRPLDNIQVSPYRITRIIDTEGKVHPVRQDTRTEFECSRQGYFVHPRSCNRFYRCVKFNQLTDEFNVFEFDCPAGLAFDNRVEVCVWPGSLPDGSACSGSSEIAPVPRERFICPHEVGYYADPENCRWFFACLDHGKSSLTAYEFRCPFGLVFDQDKLICEWPWLVPKCAHGYESGILVEFHGGAYGSSGTIGGIDITGANGVIGTTGFKKPQAIILENYNGLGVLQPVALGGIHGTIEESVPKIYTSFVGGHDSLVTSQNGVNGEQQQAYVNGEVVQGHNLLNGNSQGQLDTSYIGVAGQGSENGLHNYQPSLTHVLVGKPIISYQGNLRGGQLTGSDINRNEDKILSSGQNLHSLNNIHVAENYGLDGSSVNKHILAEHTGERGSIRYQGDISAADNGLNGKSTVTYHGSFGDSGNADAYNLVNGIENNRYVLNTDDDGQYNSNQGIHLIKNIESSQLSNLGTDRQNILNEQFGQRGSIKFQRIGGLDGESTVTYHGNFGKASHANRDYVNSPYDQANLDFGTKISSGEKFASNYIKASDQADNLKSTDQELINNQNTAGQILGITGHSQLSTNIGNIATEAPDGVILGQIDGSNVKIGANDVQGTITYHGNTGVSLEAGSLGLNSEFINQEGNVGIAKETAGEYISDNINSGLLNGVRDQTFHSISKLNKDNLLNTNRGSVKYQTNLADAVADNLDAVVLNQANQHSGISNSYQNFNRHKTGRVNIVGGGFSAVGVYPNTYKHTTTGVQTVTASPITINPVTVTSSNIPVVTSVPIPSTGTDDKLDIYNGNGVIANVPELQVKVQSPSEAIIPNHQGIHIASTGVPLEAVEGGYVYDKPTVPFVQSGPKIIEDSGAKSYIRQHINHQLVNTAIPIVSESPAISTQPVGTNIAIEQFQTLPYNAQHFGNVNNIQESSRNNYPKATIAFEDQREHIIQPVVDTQKSVVGNVYSDARGHSAISYSYQDLRKTANEENLTPSILTQPIQQTIQQITKPVSSVSSVHFGTAVVDSVTPSVLVQPVGETIIKQPVQTVEVSTLKPNLYSSVHHVNTALVENVTPSVLVNSLSPIHTYDFNKAKGSIIENVTPSISVQPIIKHETSSPASTISSVHFGSSVTDNITPSFEVQSVAEPVVKQPVETVEVNTARPISHSFVQHFKTALTENVTPSILVEPVQPILTYDINNAQSNFVNFGKAAHQNLTSLPVQPIGETLVHRPIETYEFNNIKPILPYDLNHYRKTNQVENVTPTVFVQTVGQTLVEQPARVPISSHSSVHFGTNAVIESVTPSVLLQPAQEIRFQQPLQAVEINKNKPSLYSSIHFGRTNVENVTPSILIQPVQEAKVHRPVLEQTGYFRELDGNSAYFHQNDNILKSANVENITPTSSFDFQNLGRKNVETQNINVASVTSSILIKETTEPSVIITSFKDNSANVNAHSSFLSSISKNRGFTKYIDVQPVTPPTLLQETLPAIPKLPPLQSIQQGVLNEAVENESNRGTYFYQNTKSRGFTKFADVQSVTPAPILQETLPVYKVPLQQSVSNENLGTSFSYQTFGLKTENSPLVVDNNQEALGKNSYFKTKNEEIGYHYSKPSVIFNEEPAPFIEYEGLEPVKEEPFVAKKAYITGAQINGETPHGFGSTVVYEENYPVTQAPIISSTPLFVPSTIKPTYQSTIHSTYNSVPSTTVRPLKFYYHDSRLISSARPFSIKANITPATVTTPKGIISSTPKPITSEVFVPIHDDFGQSTVTASSPETFVTQSKPVFKYSFSSLDSQYSPLPTPVDIDITKRPILNKIHVTTPTISTYRPVEVKSTTLQPLLEVNNVVNVPSKAYLPITTYIENYEAPILRNRSKSKAIVKVNDFHPLLSAKLGAQCTCISNTLRLKNRPVRVQIDDGENIDEFIVKPEGSDLIGISGGENINSDYDGELGVPAVDSLSTLPDYKSQNLIVNTPVPEVIIGSTVPAISKTPLIVRKRVRVRPVQSTTPVFFEAPVTQATDIFIKGTTSNDLQLLDEPQVNINDVNKASLTDINILTQTAREDAKEVLKAHNFDRYGPGGLRSKVETLQGTIDCQRAGLFRHPTQCNKFYSCRWDCTKNKYTLHIFNCPVHLTFDNTLGACNWPSQGPACLGNTLLPSD